MWHSIFQQTFQKIFLESFLHDYNWKLHKSKFWQIFKYVIEVIFLFNLSNRNLTEVNESTNYLTYCPDQLHITLRNIYKPDLISIDDQSKNASFFKFYFLNPFSMILSFMISGFHSKNKVVPFQQNPMYHEIDYNFPNVYNQLYNSCETHLYLFLVISYTTSIFW